MRRKRVDKQEHEHFFKELNRHLHDADTYSTQDKVLHHIKHAKTILSVIADDLGIEIQQKGE
jgi:hypothetical protein